MTDEWTEVQSGGFAKFTDPGDTYTGYVIEYNANEGGTTYDGDECGVLVLEDRETGEAVTITLDKKALSDPVKMAFPEPGKLIQVEFDEWRESKSGREYKHFTVRHAPGRAVQDTSDSRPTLKGSVRDMQKKAAAAVKPKNESFDAEAPF